MLFLVDGDSNGSGECVIRILGMQDNDCDVREGYHTQGNDNHTATDVARIHLATRHN